ASAFAVRHKSSDEIHAAVVILNDGRTAYYWIAGSRPGDGMTVLIGELLPRLFNQGIELFDFMGANTPGIAEFKRKFGARLVPYFALTRCREDLTLLRTLRNMWR
ncbi:MAG: GNAT family N-acetyltransferase, partial [Rhodothermales bacterium]